MRRADRLFQIIQILRRSSRPITASRIAEELETSRRSVYRDIADLVGQRVPIRGEAGLGYVLDRDYDMPPLMLTPDELEAAVLGAQWVADKGDAVLAGAARDLIAKIATVVPERLRPFVSNPTVGAPLGRASLPDGLDIAKARASIRKGHKIRIRYRNEQGDESERVIWPTMIGYAETVRLIAAWCELRQDFRHFRTDRIRAAEFLDERIGCRPGELRNRWKRHMAALGIHLPQG
ncbi:putative transcription regulator protein, deoR-family [Mesorhizobium plurifarium]|uniref:Putative transcription regulator protein, deoR-family n=1 Tax=Mesorhizobium plurifarium TaxID=69974 RepID=A0A090GC00_MESPL|nr:putative transcription regulator protein, deoR-family [Mesorhizobium plurifarium]